MRLTVKTAIATTITVAAGAGLCFPQAAVAQTPSESGASDSATTARRTLRLEEVIVTARRTEESAQDIPVSVTAFSSEALRRESISSAQDLQGRVASLSVVGGAQQRDTQNLTIRGQASVLGTPPSVVAYYAEVPFPVPGTGNGIQGGPGMFFDLADLQVLKGPQGTLFGRNTTGGALLMTPQKPEDDFSFQLGAEASRFNGRAYEAVVNVPLVADTLLLRMGGQIVKRDGFTKDVTTGVDYDDKDYWTTRLGLTWRPTDRIDNYLLGYYTHQDNNGTGVVLDGFNPQVLNKLIAGGLASQAGIPPELITQEMADELNLGCTLLDVNANSSNCGQSLVDEQRARGVRRVELSANPYNVIKTYAIIDHLDITLNDHWNLRYIGSFTSLKNGFAWDDDGSRAQMFDNANARGVYQINLEQVTHEVQLQGDLLDDHLSIVLGNWYEEVKPGGAQVGQAVVATLPAADRHWAVTTKSQGPFFQFTYDLGHLFGSLQGLNFTSGARLIKASEGGTTNATGSTTSGKQKATRVAFTAGFDYTIPTANGETLLYAKFSRGIKNGGFSTQAVSPENRTFKPETNNVWEIGEKSDFMVGGVATRVNTSFFYTDYKDLQRAAVDIASVDGQTLLGNGIFNVQAATIYGAELEASAVPFAGLTVAVTYGYTKAEYDDFTLPQNFYVTKPDCSGEHIPAGGTQDFTCTPFGYTPENTASASVIYDLPVAEWLGQMRISATYAWTDKQFVGFGFLPESQLRPYLDSYGLLNASLDWSGIFGSGVSLQIFGTNLTDETYRISDNTLYPFLGVAASIYGEPRIAGVRLRYEY